MSFNSEYQELRKKRKKQQEEGTQKVVSGNPLNTPKQQTVISGNPLKKSTQDIAPVRVVSTFAPVTSDAELTLPIIGELDLFQEGALKSGVTAKNVGKAILGTTVDIALGSARGVMRFAEGIGDAINYGIAGVSDLVGADDFAEGLRNETAKSVTDQLFGDQTQKVAKWSVLGESSRNLTEQIGNFAVFGGLGKLGELAKLGKAGITALTTGAMGVSGVGSGMSEAYQGDVTDEQALKHGLNVGTIEALSELLFGGMGKAVNSLGFSKGITSIDDVFAKKVSNLFTNQFAKNVAEYSVKAGAEGVEELIAGAGDIISKKFTLMSDKDWLELIEDENLLEQAFAGIVGSGFAQSYDLYQANKSGRDFVSGLTQDEQSVVDKVVEDRVAEKEAKGETVSNKDKNKIYDDVLRDLDKGYISTDTIEEVLGGETYKSYKDTVDKEDALYDRFEKLGEKVNPTLKDQHEYSELAKLVEEYKNNSQRTQLKSQLSDEVFNLAKNSRLAESYNELARRGQNFKADYSKFKDAKNQDAVKQTLENAEKSGMNNTNKMRDFVEMNARFSGDTGLVFYYKSGEEIKNNFIERQTAKINELESIENRTPEQNEYIEKLKDKLEKVKSGKITVNGEYVDGGVVINLNSATALEFTTGHEVTHNLEKLNSYTDLVDSLKRFAGKDFDRRVAEQMGVYEGASGYDLENLRADVEKEVVADLVGEYLFTDTEFINSLSTEKPNLFKKIYNEIKYLCKIATAGSREARELERVKRAFEKAYKESANTKVETDTEVTEDTHESNTKYSLVTDEDTIAFLENQDYVVTYKAMQVIDGKLYPPMSAEYKVEEEYTNKKGEKKVRTVKKLKQPSELGKWQQSEENVEVAKQSYDAKKGYSSFELLKGDGKSLKGVAYNPYEHTSNIVLNDQFSSAHRRDNLVTVEYHIPVSELTSGYKAEYSKDAVGKRDWHTGLVASNLKNTKRDVYLTRWSKPVRVLNDTEVAQKYKEILDKEDGVTVPWNVVTQSLREELEKAGVPIDYSDKKIGTSTFNFEASLRGEYLENKKNGKSKAKNNTKYSLSEKQQEYFKDSVVRDENGNLKVMYHGTSKGGHTVFDTYGSNYGLFGQGSYFTDNKSVAESYTNKGKGNNKQVYETYLNITNPIDMDADADVNAWQKALPEADFSNCTTNEDCYRAMEEYFEDEQYSKYEASEIAIDTIQSMGYDGITHIGGGRVNADGTRHQVYIAFEPEQIKNIDNIAPTSDADIRYSLSEDSSIEDKINSAMTMAEAKDMIQRAFVVGGIKEWYDGEYKNGDEWIKGEGASEVALYIENDFNLQSKYINNNEDILNEEYLLEDVLDAYLSGTLIGNKKDPTVRLDTSKDTGYKDNRFYAPQDIKGGQDLYNIASQRVTNANRQEVYKARADFIINAHNTGYVESLGLTRTEVNKKLKSWANYTPKAMELSNSLNKGVATQNRWTGIENSSIVNTISVSDEDMGKLVKSIEGHSSEWQRKYITSTMLALDTHINYQDLSFVFDGSQLHSKTALGEYSNSEKVIRIRQAGQNTVAHEMGHYLDYLWGKDLGNGSFALTERAVKLDGLNSEQAQFVKNFYNFLSDIESSSDIGSEYKMSSKEVFARFVARFVEWTKNQATNNRYGYEAKWYNDKFTESQYREFVKILQEKALLDTTRSDIRYSLSPAELDKQYLSAVKNGDMETAQRMVNEYAKENGYTTNADWKMQHSAPNSQDDVSLYNLKESGLVPDDFWERPEWYTYSPEERESYYKVKKAIETQERRIKEGIPRDAGFWVYRAVDKTVNTKEGTFRNGDWVTPSYDYAVNEGKMNPKGYRIIKGWVSLKNLYWDGNSIAELGYDDGNTYAYADTTNNRKLLDAVTDDDSGNIIPLSKRFKRRNADVRYSLSTEKDIAPTFYSQMGRVVDGIKQDKIGASSVVNYLKGKGVKNEEIKWSGIEEFVEGKKSVTKQELQEFVANSMLQIEEETLGNSAVEKFNEEWKRLVDNEYDEENMPPIDENFVDGVKDFVYDLVEEEEIDEADAEHLIELAIDVYESGGKGATRWQEHSINLPDGENYREYIFKLPNSQYSNYAMRTHWGEDAKGVLAHARVQDFTDTEGNKVLFIEEIQSDWHNEGAKKGYADKDRKTLTIGQYSDDFNPQAEIKNGYGETVAEISKVGDKFMVYEPKSEHLWEFNTEKEALNTLSRAFEKSNSYVEDAPFRNNYHEFVLKNLIRTATEQGYDKIAWTTGKMQEERWSSEYAEGYRIEYDQDIPKFLNKYGKKWGAKVGTTTLNGTNVHSMNITDSMKNSVLYEGQPFYSLLDADNLPKLKGSHLTYGGDIKLRTTEDIAPVVENTTDADVVENTTSDIPEGFAPLTEEEAIAYARENFANLDDADAPPVRDTERYNLEDDITIDDKSLRQLAKTIGDSLSMNRGSRAELEQVIRDFSNNKYSSRQELYADVERRFGTVYTEELNDTLADAKDVVRNTKIYVSPTIKSEFGSSPKDYTQFMRSNFGKIKFSKEGVEVDSVYENLNEMYPHLFPGDIWNPADRLKRIAEVMNKPTKDFIPEALPSEMIEEATDLIYDSILEYKDTERFNIAYETYNEANEYLFGKDAPIQEAPTREYEVIKPRPEKLVGEEEQWAKNKMARADKVKGNAEQTAKIITDEPKVEKKKNRAWSKFVSNFVDKASPFETLALKTGNREVDAKFNTIRYAEGKAQNLIGKGTEGVKALNDIITEVKNDGLTDSLYEYLYHKHNVDRMTLEDRYKDVPNKAVFGDSVTAKVSQDIVDQYEFAEPKLVEYANEIYNYNRHLRKMLVDGGVISQETADLWEEMYPHYVPIRRQGDDGLNINVPLDTGRTGVNAPIKRATGGSRDILPLFDTMAQRTIQTYKAIAKNRFGVELKNTLGTTVENAKTNLDEVIDSIDTQESLLQEGKNGRNPTFTVFENGEKVTFEITEEMYDALKPTSEGLAYTNKTLNTINNVRRGLLTEYNPTFMLTNAVKDAQDVLINSQHPARTYKNFPKAIKELTTKGGKWYNEYIENGGEQNTYFEKDTSTFKEEKTGIAKLIGMPLDMISDANNFIERIPRLAEYIASREMGRSIDVAMLDSARVTTNFSAGGDVTKFLNRNGATFLNASVQGAMQQVRNVREAKYNGLKGWLQLGAKTMIAGLPALLLNGLLWDDDEEYEELSDYVKENYYIVAKFDDGKFVRIPKGRTVAVIQNAFEQVANALTGDDEVDLNRFLELAISNLAPNNPLDNNVIAPIMQVANNETWYGEDLVPTRLQDLPNAEQYDESTDAISKWLGEKLNYSPYKINYLLDQYSGGVGDMVLPMLTPEAESGDNSLGGNLLAPLKDKFSTDSVMNNQVVSDFYKTSDELTTNAKSSKATDEDILKYKYINSVQTEMGELYAEKREIQNSNLSDEVKYKKVREIQEEINALSENALNTYGTVNIDGNYANVGDRYYRLNDENEWQKINDKQLEKQEKVTSGLGITPAEYWNNKAEYDYAYDSPEKYAVAKVVGGYSAYKTYSSELYDIKADKDSNGKSISGSRKEKVLDYINNLDIDYYEKIILFKSEYNADDTYNYEIIDYLNNRDDISYEEEVIILKELGFNVDSNGNISWD